ncbi:unnamed protein product [Cochlearia groenlandica]
MFISASWAFTPSPSCFRCPSDWGIEAPPWLSATIPISYSLLISSIITIGELLGVDDAESERRGNIGENRRARFLR